MTGPIDDSFIGATEMNAGRPQQLTTSLSGFPYGDPAATEELVRRHQVQIACLMLESGPGTHEYLAGLRDLAHSYGALLIFDEMITGFRWSEAGGI